MQYTAGETRTLVLGKEKGKEGSPFRCEDEFVNQALVRDIEWLGQGIVDSNSIEVGLCGRKHPCIVSLFLGFVDI